MRMVMDHPARSPITTWIRVGLTAIGTALAVGLLELTAILREQPHGLMLVGFAWAWHRIPTVADQVKAGRWRRRGRQRDDASAAPEA